MKILYYLRALNIGGAETFVYNVLEKMDFNKFVIDIVLQSNNNENERLISLCDRKKIKIYYISPFEKDFWGSYRQLRNLVRLNKYDIIHYHANSLINIIPLLVAKRTNCKLAIHSHNSNNNIGGFVGRTIHYFNRWMTNRSKIIRLSCSEKAGLWMFGKKPYQIVNNGINLETFGYDISARNDLRDKLGIDSKTIVWGHVGRFVQAKNHTFLVECFEAYNLINPNSKLILLGEGPLFLKIKANTTNKNIIFLGSRQDTSKYFSLFDIMVFPSFFEGLPFVLVEAQASGLPILASDTITKLVNVTGLIKYESLTVPITNWLRNIPSVKLDTERKEIMRLMQDTEFDSSTLVYKISQIYMAENHKTKN